LKNLALAWNLKSKRRMSFKEMLSYSGELTFVYSLMEDSNNSIPSIRILQLSNHDNKVPSYKLAEELSLKCNLPSNFISSLAAKIRIAGSKGANHNIVLASILAYNIFCKFVYNLSE
jgi:hypothetical protein